MAEPETVVGVFTTDRELIVRSWDRWLEQATGIAEGVACGRPLAELFPDMEERGLLARLRNVVETGAVEVLAPAFHRHLITCPPRQPSAHFTHMQQHVTISPLRGAHEVAGAIVTLEDVTARLDRERELAAQLRSSDEAVRLRAARALADEGGRPALLGEVLGDRSWRVRQAASGGLAQTEDGSAVELLISAIRDRHRDPAVLNTAVTALVGSSLNVLPRVLDLLEEGDADVRTYAALALGLLGDSRAVEPLVQLLDDPDRNVRYHAIEALGRLGARDTAPALSAIAEGDDEYLAFVALDALGELREPAVAPRILPLLDREALRAAAAAALGRLADEDAAPALAERLNGGGALSLPLAAALAAMYERLQRSSGAGELVADATRAAVSTESIGALAGAIPYASDAELEAVVVVLGWLPFAGIPELLGPLLEHPRVRRASVAALVRQGAAGVPVLLEALKSEESRTRRAAAQALGEIGSPLAVPALCALLGDEAEVAIVAAGALGAIGDRSAFEPLLAELDSPDAAVRQAVIAAVHSIGHPETRSRVDALLADPSPRVRESAVRIAGYFGYPESLPVLLERCGDDEEAVRRAAVEQIALFEEESVLPALARALEDAPSVRSAAARALAHTEQRRALPLLERALADPDPWVRYHAARCAAAQGGAPLLARLAELALTDPAPPVRIAAAEALGATRVPDAAAALCTLAATAQPDVARAAVAALSLTPGAEALVGLLAALDGPDEGVRLAVLAALGERGDPGAVARIGQIAQHAASETERDAALAALGRIGGAPAVAVLLQACVDRRAEPAAVDALASLPGDQLAELSNGLRDPDARVRRSVVEALARRRDGRAAPLLADALEDRTPVVRQAAARALRRLDLRSVRGRLERLAHSDDDAAVREAAQSALSK